MIRIAACIMLFVLAIGHAGAGSRQAGQFDYYVLALGWSPSWCALEGDARNADQCDSRHDYGFTLHGLWPQYETGWPSFCATAERPPSRQMTREMTDIMGSGGLAWHQWDKHGRCSGLSAAEYYALSRQAYGAIERPQVFRKLLKPLEFPATVVEEAFLKSNPALSADMISVTCERGWFKEVRICLSKDLTPRACGADVARDCRQRVIFPPVR
ncbi:MAG: ribonuclease T2 [Rhodobacteraceae bacterium]|nr:ribonuclease T2 [Paracoccaceae bacterium]